MIQRRFTKGAEVRAKDDGHIAGHAAVFDEEYVMWDSDYMRVAEVIRSGAFKEAIKAKQDVRCLINHDANQIIGRTAAGTMTLKEDERGLFYDCEPPDTQLGRDIRTLIKRNDITGCSFAFTVGDEVRTEEKKGKKYFILREIKRVDMLYDAGPVTYPAYEGTDVAARAKELRAAGLPLDIAKRIAELEQSDEQLCSRCQRAIRSGPGADSVCTCTCANCQATNCAECTDKDYKGEHDLVDDDDDERQRVLDDIDTRMRIANVIPIGSARSTPPPQIA